jgi:septum formation protein
VPPVTAPLILASRSPQRTAILDQLGIAHEVMPADVLEEDVGPAHVVARENALRKALAIAAEHPGRTVLGVDTVVDLDGLLYGKPADEQAAQAMLQRLSGRTHEVVSAIALVRDGQPQAVHEGTEVRFRELPETLVEWYLQTGEWRGRAGGYAIQGRGAGLVRAIAGDYLNVVGLPVGALLDLDSSLMLSQK